MGAVTTRRFPAPWLVRELEQAFRIEDATGHDDANTEHCLGCLYAPCGRPSTRLLDCHEDGQSSIGRMMPVKIGKINL